MIKSFPEEMAIKIKKANDVIYHICPDCINHKYDFDENKYYDCKNTFINKNGDNIGQCMCYSIEHGLKEA